MTVPSYAAVDFGFYSHDPYMIDLIGFSIGHQAIAFGIGLIAVPIFIGRVARRKPITAALLLISVAILASVWQAAFALSQATEGGAIPYPWGYMATWLALSLPGFLTGYLSSRISAQRGLSA